MIDDVNSHIDDWNFLMRNKFIDNVDRFVTKIEKIAYVMFRLIDKTFIHYRTRNKVKSFDFDTFADVINLFFTLFENFDYKRNMKRFFRRFQQEEIQSFNKFYYEFVRLSSELLTTKKDFIEKFSNKLNKRFKKTRLDFTKKFKIFNETQRKFQKLNNNFIHHEKKLRNAIKQSKSFIVKSFRIVFDARSNSTSVAKNIKTDSIISRIVSYNDKSKKNSKIWISSFAKLLKNINVSFAMRRITSINIVHTKTNQTIFIYKNASMLWISKNINMIRSMKFSKKINMRKTFRSRHCRDRKKKDMN